MKNILKYALAFIVGIGISFGSYALAATVVSLGKDGTVQYLLYPNDSLKASFFTGTSTTANSVFPRVSITNGTTTNATSTNLTVSGRLNLFGTIGTALSDFCVAITGGSGLCDGNDATGGGGGGSGAWATNTANTLTYLDSPWTALIGGTATTSTSSLEVQGNKGITSYGVITAPYFTATSTAATSTFTGLSTIMASTTGLRLPGTGSTECLQKDANGYVTGTGSACGSGGGTPGGSDTQVQFNDAGAFAGEAGFEYIKSPTSQLFVPEVRSATYADPTGVSSLNPTATSLNLTANNGIFNLAQNGGGGTALFDISTLTVGRSIVVPNKDGTLAMLSDITNASSTLLTDNNTFSGNNRFGNDTDNILVYSAGISQFGTSHVQSPYAILTDFIRFGFDGPADPGTDGGYVQFSGNSGGTGNTNGGSVIFDVGAPQGTGATGTYKFGGANGFYTNLRFSSTTVDRHQTFQDKDGTIALLSDIMGGGASSTLHVDNNTFTGQNIFASILRSTTTNATTTSLFSSVASSTLLATTYSTSSVSYVNTNFAVGCAPQTANKAIICDSGAGTVPVVLSLNNTQSGNGSGERIAFTASPTLSSAQGFIDFIRSNSGASGASYFSFGLHNGTAVAERVRFSERGYVGIGTSSPWAVLSVHTNIGSSSVPIAAFSTSSPSGTATTTPFLLGADGVLTLQNLLMTSSSTWKNATATAIYSEVASSSVLSATNGTFGSVAIRSLTVDSCTGCGSGGGTYSFYTLPAVSPIPSTQATNTPVTFTQGSYASFFTATSTTATSTFANFNGEYWATSTTVDIGKQVMNYYNKGWGDMVTVNIPPGIYNQDVASFPINANTAGKKLKLVCPGGDATVINLTGVGTSTILNAGNGGVLGLVKNGYGVFGCSFNGDLTTGQMGIQVGGDQGAQGAVLQDVGVFNTDIGIVLADNIAGGVDWHRVNSQFNNKNLMTQFTVDAGEGINISGFNFSDCQIGHMERCVDFASTIGSSIHLDDGRIDNGQLYIADGNFRVTVSKTHFENPNVQAVGKYTFIKTGSGGYGALSLIGNTFWNGATTTAKSPYVFIDAGNPVEMEGNSFSSDGIAMNALVSTYGDGRIINKGAFVSFGSIANLQTFSTSTTVDFTIDHVTHNVGIGTSSPYEKFSVNGNAVIDGNLTITGTCTGCGGGSGSPASPSGGIQYNNGGSFGANADLFWENSTERLAIGTSTPWAKVGIQGVYGSTHKLFEIASSTNSSGSATTSLLSIMMNGTVGISSSSPQSLLSVHGVFGSTKDLFSVATTTNGTGNTFDVFKVMANGRVVVVSPSGTSTKMRVLNEPDVISVVTTANYMSTFSDDPSRMIQCGTAAGSNVSIRNGSFSGSAATNVFLPPTIKGQLITWTTLYNNVVVGRGCLTNQGYHYVMYASTTNAAATAIRRATSSDYISMASSTAWSTSTISGVALFTTSYLVGATDNALYVASSSATQIQEYLISTSTNTLTANRYFNFTGAAIAINTTRVNSNGMYIGFSAASDAFLRKFDFSGVQVPGAGYIAAAPSTTGPDLFAMRNSIYALSAGATTLLTRVYGW